MVEEGDVISQDEAEEAVSSGEAEVVVRGPGGEVQRAGDVSPEPSDDDDGGGGSGGGGSGRRRDRVAKKAGDINVDAIGPSTPPSVVNEALSKAPNKETREQIKQQADFSTRRGFEKERVAAEAADEGELAEEVVMTQTGASREEAEKLVSTARSRQSTESNLINPREGLEPRGLVTQEGTGREPDRTFEVFTGPRDAQEDIPQTAEERVELAQQEQQEVIKELERRETVLENIKENAPAGQAQEAERRLKKVREAKKRVRKDKGRLQDFQQDVEQAPSGSTLSVEERGFTLRGPARTEEQEPGIRGQRRERGTTQERRLRQDIQEIVGDEAIVGPPLSVSTRAERGRQALARRSRAEQFGATLSTAFSPRGAELFAANLPGGRETEDVVGERFLSLQEEVGRRGREETVARQTAGSLTSPFGTLGTSVAGGVGFRGAVGAAGRVSGGAATLLERGGAVAGGIFIGESAGRTVGLAEQGRTEEAAAEAGTSGLALVGFGAGAARPPSGRSAGTRVADALGRSPERPTGPREGDVPGAEDVPGSFFTRGRRGGARDVARGERPPEAPGREAATDIIGLETRGGRSLGVRQGLSARTARRIGREPPAEPIRSVELFRPNVRSRVGTEPSRGLSRQSAELLGNRRGGGQPRNLIFDEQGRVIGFEDPTTGKFFEVNIRRLPTGRKGGLGGGGRRPSPKAEIVEAEGTRADILAESARTGEPSLEFGSPGRLVLQSDSGTGGRISRISERGQQESGIFQMNPQAGGAGAVLGIREGREDLSEVVRRRPPLPEEAQGSRGPPDRVIENVEQLQVRSPQLVRLPRRRAEPGEKVVQREGQEEAQRQGRELLPMSVLRQRGRQRGERGQLQGRGQRPDTGQRLRQNQRQRQRQGQGLNLFQGQRQRRGRPPGFPDLFQDRGKGPSTGGPSLEEFTIGRPKKPPRRDNGRKKQRQRRERDGFLGLGLRINPSPEAEDLLFGRRNNR